MQRLPLRHDWVDSLQFLSTTQQKRKSPRHNKRRRHTRDPFDFEAKLGASLEDSATESSRSDHTSTSLTSIALLYSEDILSDFSDEFEPVLFEVTHDSFDVMLANPKCESQKENLDGIRDHNTSDNSNVREVPACNGSEILDNAIEQLAESSSSFVQEPREAPYRCAMLRRETSRNTSSE